MRFGGHLWQGFPWEAKEVSDCGTVWTLPEAPLSAIGMGDNRDLHCLCPAQGGVRWLRAMFGGGSASMVFASKAIEVLPAFPLLPGGRLCLSSVKNSK